MWDVCNSIETSKFLKSIEEIRISAYKEKERWNLGTWRQCLKRHVLKTMCVCAD